MSTIADYQIVARVYESVNLLAYRVLPNRGDRSVFLKVLKKDYLNPSELTRYQQEYKITHALGISINEFSLDIFKCELTWERLKYNRSLLARKGLKQKISFQLSTQLSTIFGSSDKLGNSIKVPQSWEI